MKLDMHVHTTFSDGLLTVRELVEECSVSPVHGFVVTDHNTAEVCRHVEPGWHGDVFVGTGMEYTCGCGSDILLYGEPGDLLALWANGDMPLLKSMGWVLSKAGAFGLVPVLAHPFRPTQPADIAGARGNAATLAAIETINGKNRFRFPGSNDKAVSLAVDLGLPATGGSDGHRPGELSRAWTCLPHCLSWEDVLDSLSEGRFLPDAGDR